MSGRRHKKARGGTPEALASLLKRVYPSREPEDAAAIRVFGWWRRAVPERVLARARPVRLARGILYVHTATSAWASELDHLKDALLNSVRKHAPEARIKDVRFRPGPLPELPATTRPEKPRPHPIPVAALPESLARVLAGIDDDELREAIASAAGVSLGRDKAR